MPPRNVLSIDGFVPHERILRLTFMSRNEGNYIMVMERALSYSSGLMTIACSRLGIDKMLDGIVAQTLHVERVGMSAGLA